MQQNDPSLDTTPTGYDKYYTRFIKNALQKSVKITAANAIQQKYWRQYHQEMMVELKNRELEFADDPFRLGLVQELIAEVRLAMVRKLQQ